MFSPTSSISRDSFPGGFRSGTRRRSSLPRSSAAQPIRAPAGILMAPLAVQEIVLAVGLIVRGSSTNPSTATATRSPRQCSRPQRTRRNDHQTRRRRGRGNDTRRRPAGGGTGGRRVLRLRVVPSGGRPLQPRLPGISSRAGGVRGCGSTTRAAAPGSPLRSPWNGERRTRRGSCRSDATAPRADPAPRPERHGR
jgi:hypothetical protein